MMCRLVPFTNGGEIADIKYHQIKNITNQAEKCKNIDRVILFGSSTQERCTDRSDIDIAIYGRMPKNKYLDSKEFKRFHDKVFLFDLNQDYDILYFCDEQKQNDIMLDDIQNGVGIYRRNQA